LSWEKGRQLRFIIGRGKNAKKNKSARKNGTNTSRRVGWSNGEVTENVVERIPTPKNSRRRPLKEDKPKIAEITTT